VITYRYVARSYSGETKEGYTQAASENDLLNWLRDQGYTPLNIDAISSTTSKKTGVPLTKGISSGELAAVFWQLTTMVDGGITVADSLEAIAEDLDNPRLRKVLTKLLEKVQHGGMVSEGMNDFPQVFSRLVSSLVVAGETSGNIAAAFQRAAEYFTNRDRLGRKIKKATTYPAFVFGFVILVVIAIMTLIIPRFKEMFESFGSGQLPAFTRAFMAFYDVFAANWYYIIGGLLLAIIILFLWYTRVKSFHTLCSALWLRTPLFGKLIKNASIAAFCRTASNLLRGGVPVLEVFDILADMNSNDTISHKIRKTKEGIVAGKGIAMSMTATKFFPNMVIKMIKAGEESGSLWKTLERTADYYEDKVDAQISMMTSLLEPLMIIIVGMIVMVVVIALYLPIFSISDLRSQ
jgi:type IV pilus assembly protein PilC